MEISDIAFGGKGVGRLADGRVCFVRDVIPGEQAQVRVTRATRRFAEADLEGVVSPSVHRVTPPCPYFGICGGCSYQHISYDRQMAVKTKQVGDILRRLGGIAEPPVRPGVPAPLPYGYRNRITVHRRDGKIGFHRRDGRGLVDIEACLLASDPVNDALAKARIAPSGEGAMTLREHRDRFGFHQTNDAVASLLLEAVEAACAEGGEGLVDAYCGDGFFARRLAAKFRRAIGIEWNQRSVEQARSVAGENESYLEGDVSELLLEALAAAGRATVILDPPAQGVDARVIDLLAGAAVDKLVYVSCDPATLARDLKLLAPYYTLESATPFDMFPQTAEIEVLAILKPRS